MTKIIHPQQIREIVSSIRRLEQKIWEVWGKSGASLLILCLDLKVILMGNNPGRMIRRGFFLVWQGHLDEARLLADTIRPMLISQEQERQLQKLEELFLSPSEVQKMQPVENLHQRKKLIKKLRQVHENIKLVDLSYCLEICSRLEAAIATVLGSSCQSCDLVCSKHPVQPLQQRYVELPHPSNHFAMRTTWVCPICDRWKIVYQDTEKYPQVTTESEIHYFLRTITHRNDCMKTLFSLILSFVPFLGSLFKSEQTEPSEEQRVALPKYC